jgi:diguanylate cyclase
VAFTDAVLQDLPHQPKQVGKRGLLPDATLEVCGDVAQRVRRRICEARLTRRNKGEEIASVTVSIGVEQFRMAESAEVMIEKV